MKSHNRTNGNLTEGNPFPRTRKEGYAMRRTLILVLAFAMIGVAAFADEAPPAAPPTGQFLSFFNEGQLFLYEQTGGGTPSFGWGPTWDYAYGAGIGAKADSGSIDQEWGFAFNSAKDQNGNSYGFAATIEFGGQFLLEDAAVNSFYTYYKFGDVVRILLGAPRYDLGTGTIIEGAGTMRFFNGTLIGDGIDSPGQYAGVVDLYLVPGLDITLAAFIPSVVNIANVFGSNWTGATYPFGNGAFGGWEGIATSAALNYIDNMGIAATYAVPHVGNFIVQYYRLMNYNLDGSTNGSTGDRFDFVANITAWKNYVVKLQYDANNVLPVAAAGGTAPTMTSEVWLSASASYAPWYFAFDSGLDQINTSVVSLAAEVEGEYALGSGFSVGARVGYSDANGIEFFDAGNGNWSGFQVWPYVKAVVGQMGSYIMGGFLYASGATPAGSLGYPAQKSVTAILIQYVWNFL
jgi:hypothetical protein